MTKIAWTDETWNTVAERTVRCDFESLEIPLHWGNPRLIFVNPMSDTFHKRVPDEFIDKMFAVMALCPQHTFQCLSKRPERMAEYLTITGVGYRISRAVTKIPLPPNLATVGRDMGRVEFINGALCGVTGGEDDRTRGTWPLLNVWLGTSVEDQATADERIPHLLECPAAVRFLSVEPMLGAMDLSPWIGAYWCYHCEKHFRYTCEEDHCPNCGEDFFLDGEETERCPFCGETELETLCSGCGVSSGNGGANLNECCDETGIVELDWIIIGGESGPKARPFHLEWAYDLIRQCRDAGVAVFVKQLGSNPFLDGKSYKPGNDKRTDPADWPEDLRVQKYPRAGRYLG